MSNSSTDIMGHPRGLPLLFFTELWERFSYYGMRAILMLYMTKHLIMGASAASTIYGNFTGLVYLTPLIGGYISDRYWGNRRSIITGGLLMAVGQFTLFFSASMAGSLSTALFVVGLLFLVIGNGFFKPNISTMVNQLYQPGDKRVDSAFSIFYMGINLGAFMSPLICGYLAENVHFKWGFFAAGVGMLLGTGIFHYLKDKYLLTHDGNPIGGKPNAALGIAASKDGSLLDEPAKAKASYTAGQIGLWLVVYAVLWPLFYYGAKFNLLSTFIFATSIAAAGLVLTDPSLTKVERDRIIVVYIIAFFVLFFWAAFEQAGASLTLFADQQTNRQFGTWTMPASWFQSFNAAFVVIFAPIFAYIWSVLGNRNAEPASPVKQAVGLLFLALGYLWIANGVKDLDPTTKVSIIWLGGLYLLHTFGELCLSPIGLSMVARLAPMRLASLLMGIWFMSNAMANDFAGYLSSYYPEAGAVKNFMGYQIADMHDFFMLFVYMAIIAAVILFILSRWLLKMMHGVR
jgi:proton-dependent oligopeptide transporter, POT family